MLLLDASAPLSIASEGLGIVDIAVTILGIFVSVVLAVRFRSNYDLLRANPEKKLEPVDTSPSVLDSNFVGRGEQLNWLRKHLARRHLFGLSKWVVIRNFGGMGKTSLALKFVNEYRIRFGHVLWLDATSKVTIDGSLKNISTAFQQAGYFGFDGGQVQSLKSIRPHRKPTLVIVDNLDTPPIGMPFLGNAQNARFLVTSRFSAWDANKFEALTLEVLEEAAAVEFLTKVAGQSDRVSALALAKELGMLPLAISHAAYTILERSDLGFETYLSDFNDIIQNVPSQNNYNRSIYSTITLAIQSCGIESIAASETVQVLGFLGSDSVTHGVLSSILGELGAQEDYLSIIAKLERLSLLEKVRDDAYSIHKVVQDVIIAAMTAEKRDQVLSAINKVFDEKIPSNFISYSSYLEALPLLSAVERVLDLKSDATAETVSLINQYVTARLQWGLDSSIEEVVTRLDNLTSSVELSDLLLDKAQNNIGGYFQRSGEYRKSLTHFEQAISISRSALATDPEDNDLRRSLAMRMSNWARSVQFMAEGESSEAEVAKATLFMNRALDLARHIGDAQFLSVRLNNLAMFYRDFDNLDDALPLMEEAKSVAEGCFDPVDTTLGIRLRNLSQIQFETGYHAEALANIIAAIEIFEVVDDLSPDKLIPPYTTLASVAESQSDVHFSHACDRLYDLHVDFEEALGPEIFRMIRKNELQNMRAFRFLNVCRRYVLKIGKERYVRT